MMQCRGRWQPPRRREPSAWGRGRAWEGLTTEEGSDLITILCALLLSIITLVGCGGGGDSAPPAETALLDTLRLVPVDTIGVEMGDSNYVFGTILAAGIDRRGRTLVLDAQRCRLSAFSDQGAYLGFAGGRGSGPGELQFPMDFAVLGDGGLVITDLQSSQLTFYDTELQYIGSLAGFFPTAPMFLDGFHDSLFVALDISLDMETDQPTISSRAGIWGPDSAGPGVVLAALSQPASQRPPEGEAVEELSVAASDSFVFVGYVSVDRFLVEVYDARGNLVTEISRPWERVEKTPEEMEQGGMAISVMRDGEGGSTTEARSVEDVVPWRNALERVGADGQGRLWVELGSPPDPQTFEVYDPESGNLLFMAVADSSLSDGMIAVSPGGFVHFSPNPEDYPKAIRLALRE